MNKVVITGRITKDIELRQTKNGTSTCQFVIATNRPIVRDGKKETDFITCIAWNKQAENLAKYQRKGNLIAICGELRVDSYEIEGEKKYKSYVLANDIEYLEAKKDMANDEYEDFQTISTKTNSDVSKQIEIEDSDLPW